MPIRTLRVEICVAGICILTNILASAAAYARRPTWPFLSVEGGVGVVLRAAVSIAELGEPLLA